MKKILAIILLGLFLSGCETLNTERKNDILAYEKAYENFKNEVANDKNLDPIRSKFWFDEIATAPFKNFANKEYVNTKEKKALEKYQEHVARVMLVAKPAMRNLSMREATLFEQWNAGLFSIFIDLYQGKITYGDYHLKKKEMSGRYEEEINRNVNYNNNSVVDNDLTDYLILNDLINQSNQSTRMQPFTCTNLGGFINCY